MPQAPRRILLGPDGADIHRNGDAKISVTLSDGPSQIAEGVGSILGGIAGENQATAPPHQFIEAKVLKMATIGKVDKARFRTGKPKQLLRQVPEPKAGAWLHPSGARRIAHPPSQAHIEDRQQERQRRR